MRPVKQNSLFKHEIVKPVLYHFHLRGFFHGSAHARVLRNFKSVFRRGVPVGTKPVSEVLRGEVSKVVFILKIFLCITHR